MSSSPHGADDVFGLAIRKIARLMNPAMTLIDGAVKQAKRDIPAGRVRLHHDGVLPWAAFASGDVEPEWWVSGQLADAIQQWRAEAATKPSPLPPSNRLSREEIERVMLGPAVALGKAITDGVEPIFERLARSIVGLPQVDEQLREIERKPWRWPVDLLVADDDFRRGPS